MTPDGLTAHATAARLIWTGAGRPTPESAAKLGWLAWMARMGLDPARYLGRWDPDEPTPWAYVRSAHDVSSLRRAYDRIDRMAAT